MNILVIVPTYNEKDNIARLIAELLCVHASLDILVIDDNSPDGTAGVVKALQPHEPRLHLIVRAGKFGLGTAYRAGFAYALEHGYDYVFEMDADFSHNPREIPQFLDAIGDCDLVLGSRYVRGVTVVHWPFRRLLLSYGANVYARIVTGLPFKDTTSGFKCFRRKVLAAIDLRRVHSNGYAFQVEMTFRAWKQGFRIVEIPILFVDRAEGASKMSWHVIFEAVWMVWKLRLLSLFGRLQKPDEA